MTVGRMKSSPTTGSERGIRSHLRADLPDRKAPASTTAISIPFFRFGVTRVTSDSPSLVTRSWLLELVDFCGCLVQRFLRGGQPAQRLLDRNCFDLLDPV